MFGSMETDDVSPMFLLKLKPYMLRYRRQYVAGFAALLLTVVFGGTVPWLLKYPIDILRDEGATPSFYLHILFFLAVALLAGVARFFMRRILIGISRKIEYDFRNDLFAHLQKLSLSFYHRYRTGDIMARATNDINAVRNVLGPGIMYSVYTLIYTLYALSMMLQINIRLTLLALLPFPVVAFGVNRVIRHLYRYSHDVQTLYSDLTSRVEENISGIRVVKAYRQEKRQMEAFKQLNLTYMRKNLKLALFRGAMFAGITLLSGMGIAIILYFGGRGVISGQITLGEFVSFNTYLLTLTWPMIAVGWVINLFQMGSASYSRIQKIFAEQPEVRDTARTNFAIRRLSGEIECRHVYFKYHRDSDFVLRDVSFRIEAGMFVGIVGETGCGKTTLVRLLARLYEPQRGKILIGGHEIREIPLSVLRREVGVVPQDDFLFSETIRENIAFSGNGEYGPEAIEKIARVVQIDREITEFVDRYETLLGERGINLSGGQKQRIAIARAALLRPKILILDDALSAVDTATEKSILENLKREFRGTTRIMVSHRVASLADADLILVMENGAIVEKGTHSELLRKDGIYANLYYKQLIEEELEHIE